MHTNRSSTAESGALSAACAAATHWLAISALLAASWSTAAQARGPFLVKDIDPIGKASEPQDFVDVGGTLFFTADDGVHGREVWRSDGTAAGTVLVRDVRPGLESPFPFALTNVAGILYFVAVNGIDGVELWRSDGTENGTVRVTVIAARPFWQTSPPPAPLHAAGRLCVFTTATQVWSTDGTADGTILLMDFGTAAQSDDLAAFSAGGRVYFSANGELWRTDGTPANTVLLATGVSLPFAPADFQTFTVTPDGVLFVGVDSAHGGELWITDGTPGGTRLAYDLVPGPDSLYPIYITPFHDGLIFGVEYGANAGLWRTDGTPAGTVQLASVRPIHPPVVLGDVLLFTALGSTGGVQVWRSDGSRGGTAFLADTSGGSTSFTRLADTVYFLGFASGGGCTLMATHGSLQTTSPVTSIPELRGSPAGSCADPLKTVGDQLFFTGEDMHGRELWHSDGTAAGTALVLDIRPGTIDSSPHDLHDIGGRIVFVAYDSGPLLGLPNLWQSDGSLPGTYPYAPLGSASAWEIFGAVNGRLLYQQTFTDPWLWSSDGTAAGTAALTDFAVWDAPVPFNDAALFTGFDFHSLAGEGLWRTDGTRAETKNIASVQPYPGPNGVMLNGALLFFGADAPTGVELWRSDGTASGTTLVKDINPGPTSSYVQSQIVIFNERIFFVANDGQHGAELWSSDGTASGTQMVRDINPGGAGSDPASLVPAADRLFFVATDGRVGRELWVTDGTDSGTHLVADIDPGAESADPQNLTVVRGLVVFAAYDPDLGVELWRSDGTLDGTRLVRDIKPGRGSSFPMAFQTAGDRAYFVAHDDQHGWELWRTDASRAGTSIVADINPGGASAFFTTLDEYRFRVPAPQLTGVDGAVVFVADDGQHGRELWKGGANTDLLQDIAAGPVSSDPAEMTLSGRYIFFSADNEAYGRELWAVNRAEIGGACVGDCTDTWQVDVHDVITGINIVLGQSDVSSCPAIDADGDGTVTVDEIIRAVANALNGCADLGTIQPLPQPIESGTPAPSRTPQPTPTPAPVGQCRRTGCIGEICADHDIELDLLCYVVPPEHVCLTTAPCVLIGGQCGFEVNRGDDAHRCLAGFGDCVFDDDCNTDEQCLPAHHDFLTDIVESFGSCAGASP